MESLSLSPTACLHCGSQFVPLVSPSQFCCAGCEYVYELIQAKGLSKYYVIRDANPPICPIPVARARSNEGSYDEASLIVKAGTNGMRLRFYLEGMNCTACLWLLEKLPDFCQDAASARVNFADSTIDVTRTTDGSFSAIAQTLNRFGYRPHALRATEIATHLQTRERRGDLVRIAVAGALTGNIMIFSVSLYGGAQGQLADQFRWLTALLALPVLIFCALPFYRSTVFSLRHRHLSLDVPIVVAILAGIVASFWGLTQTHGAIYFDSLSMLVFLLLTSRFLLKGVQSRLLQATGLEDELLLTTVERVDRTGVHVKTSSLVLVANDLIRVPVDGMIPVDGWIETGMSAIDTSVLTGESEPLPVSQGHRVEAGSRNLTHELYIRVEHAPSQTRLARILRDTELTARAKSAAVRIADRISQWFIGAVFLAAFGLIAFFITSDPAEGIHRALALVIVTCPCVFGIAIPLSMSFAIRECARRGIVIKESDALERLWRVDILIFDKTGTLTSGEMTVLSAHAKENDDFKIALSLELGQPHPAAKAIVQYLQKQGIRSSAFDNVLHLANGGVSAQADGFLYSLRPLDDIPSPSSPELIRSTFGVYRNEEHLITFQLGDRTRPEAFPVLTWARRNGFKTKMLTGDRRHVALKLADSLDFNVVDVDFEASPEMKAIRVREIGDHAVMIGDGANDAAALATASVGIAVCGSLDASLRAADIYLTRPNLATIADLIQIARMSRNAIYRALILSASFNVVSGSLAAMGVMTPLWAAVLMPVSSLTILASAIWTGRRIRNIEVIK